MDETVVEVDTGDATVQASLAMPADAVGMVVFAHGSGSSRHSPRNQRVAQRLRRRGLATLLMDLLTPAEDEVDRRTRELRFDIGLLARRLTGAIGWLDARTDTSSLPTGFFGASTGAAAALIAAADAGNRISAVVSRGGRPDLAGDRLPDVQAPTLLLVGGADPAVLDLNQQAQERMRCETHLEVVPGATHLFEEPGALDVVADSAAEWFVQHLGS